MKQAIKFASIIVTYRCNAQCHMCNTWKFPTKQEKEITTADIDKLPSIPSINVTGGEPFLRQDINEILTVLKKKAKRVVISTNGYFTERIIETAKKHPWIGVRVSIEGLPKANDELRGLKDGFDHGIRTLIELDNLGLKDIGFGITISDRNYKDILELYHLAKMMKLEFATAAVHNSDYFHKFDNKLEKKEEIVTEINKLSKELLKRRRPKNWFRAYFNYGLANYVKGNPRLLPCEMGLNEFFLDPYGEILPCNGLPEMLSMGNIKEHSFSEVWNSPKADEVRSKIKCCGQKCWMMGSVAEPMKKNFPAVCTWVLKSLFRK